ncbi:MAG: hypothetical protein AB1401_00335 [Thermodesulfobacteriota bacterium]
MERTVIYCPRDKQRKFLVICIQTCKSKSGCESIRNISQETIDGELEDYKGKEETVNAVRQECSLEKDENGICSHLWGMSSCIERVKCCCECEKEFCNSRCSNSEPKKATVPAVMEKGTDIERSVYCKEKAEELCNRIEDSYYELAMILREIEKEQYYMNWGYSGFVEYVKECLGFKERKARYLIAIADMCQRYNITKDERIGIEWSKLKELPGVINEENKEEWLGKARESTTTNLQDEVRKARGISPGEMKSFITFSLAEGQKLVVESALDLAGKLTGSEVRSYLLEVICQEFVGTYMNMDELAIKAFERSHGLQEDEVPETGESGIKRYRLREVQKMDSRA